MHIYMYTIAAPQGPPDLHASDAVAEEAGDGVEVPDIK